MDINAIYFYIKILIVLLVSATMLGWQVGRRAPWQMVISQIPCLISDLVYLFGCVPIKND